MEVKELINDIFELERKLFMMMDSCRLLEQKCKENCLSSDEQKQLSIDIHYVFVYLIKVINNCCSDLTNEDILFCCLKKAGLEIMIAGRCVGSYSRQSINQRKYRIKKKMKSSGCDYLFDLIFLSDDLE